MICYVRKLSVRIIEQQMATIFPKIEKAEKICTMQYTVQVASYQFGFLVYFGHFCLWLWTIAIYIKAYGCWHVQTRMCTQSWLERNRDGPCAATEINAVQERSNTMWMRTPRSWQNQFPAFQIDAASKIQTCNALFECPQYPAIDKLLTIHRFDFFPGPFCFWIIYYPENRLL